MASKLEDAKGHDSQKKNGLGVDILSGSFSGPGVSKGRGCSWGTLRTPAGKIGEPEGTLL